jgi:hypothetical protein
MSETQKWIGITTVILDVLMGLFPPWHINWSTSEGAARHINKGYQFIFTPIPTGTITMSTLFVQIAVVTLVGAALFYFTKPSR